MTPMTQTGRLGRSSAETPGKIPIRFGRATNYHSHSGGFQEPVSNVPSPVRRSGSTSFRRTPEPANPSFRRRPEPRGEGGAPSVAHEVEPPTLHNRRPLQKPQPATPIIPDPDRGSRRKPDPPIRSSGEGRNLGVWATTPVVQGSARPCSRQNLATQPSKISSWAPQCHCYENELQWPNSFSPALSRKPGPGPWTPACAGATVERRPHFHRLARPSQGHSDSERSRGI